MHKDTTQSAKDVRKVLKAEYPNTKFSVRVKRSSMGSSVNITWTDGPTEKEIADKTAHLKGGEYLNEYISTYRTISRQVIEAAARAAAKYYDMTMPEIVDGNIPYVADETPMGDGMLLCDKIHWACWSTSVYDMTPEEAFARVFP